MDFAAAFEETNGEEKVSMVLDYPERLKEYENLGLKVDMQFLVGPSEEVIQGHRFMFAGVSSVFKSMLYGTFKEAENTFEIRLPSDQPYIFKKLRELIYSIDGSMEVEYMNLNVYDSIRLYRLCDKYLIKSLTDIVIRYIQTLVEEATSEDLISLLIFADEFKMLLLSSHIWNCMYRWKSYPTYIVIKLTPSLFLEFISRHSTRSGSNHTALFEIIELYLMDHMLIPKNLLNSKTERNEEERKKHEILEALLIWIDVEEIKRKLPQFKVMSYDTFNKLMNNIKAKYKRTQS